MEFGSLTDEELLERHGYYSSLPEAADGRSFEARQVQAIAREMHARQQFSERASQPLDQLREAWISAGRTAKTEPTWWDVTGGHPGILSSRRKPPEVYQAEQRQAELLKRLQDMDLGPPTAEPWAPGQAEYLRAVNDRLDAVRAWRRAWQNEPGEAASLESAYDNYGPLGAPSALTHFGRIWGAPGGMVLSGAEWAIRGGEQPYRDTMKAANTVLASFGPRPPNIPGMPRNEGEPRDYWEASERQRAESDRLRASPGIMLTPSQRRGLDELEARAGNSQTGSEFLTKMGASPGWAMAGGLVLDTLLDPNPALGAAPKILRAANLTRGAKAAQVANLARQDFQVPAAFMAGSQFYGAEEPEDPMASRAGQVLQSLLAR